MIVYADVLICINIIIDYFLIGFAGVIIKSKCSFRRQLLGAFIGGVCSLLILIERESVLIAIAVRLITSVSVTLAAFGFLNIKVFFKRLGCLYGASFLFSGALNLLLELLNPVGLIVHNGIVYYDLSALLLVVLVAVIYSALTIFSKIFKRNSEELCKIEICEGNNIASIIALIDSGNNLIEPFSEKGVALVDPKYFELLSCDKKHKRLIPYKTVSGEGTVFGFVPDKIRLLSSGEELDLYIAFSPEPLGGKYGAILPASAI